MAERLGALLVEDTEDDALLVLMHLRKAGYEVRHKRVQTREGLLAALEGEGHWDIVISDYSMPAFSGLDALVAIREREPELPFILVSGAVGEETAVALMRAGAYDYVMKDKLALLGPAVERALKDAEGRRQKRLAEERIKASLREKEMLLKEIHHRVKNNMQVISSLLRMQSEMVSDERDRGLFVKSLERIRAMSLVHEKLYSAEEFGYIELGDYVRDLASKLYQTHDLRSWRIGFVSEVPDIRLGLDTATPLGLVVNELLSNALRHAFPEADGRGCGEIRLAVAPVEDRPGMLRLTVSDNGVGMPGPANPPVGKTLGLTLAAALADQLGGELTMGTPPQGTSVSLTFRQNVDSSSFR